MKYGIKRLGQNNLGGNPNFIITGLRIFENDIITDGYEEITKSDFRKEKIEQENEYKAWYNSVYNTDILNHKETSYKDYKQARTAFKQLVADKGGFDSLNDLEKSKACEWFAVTPDEMITHFTTVEGLSANDALNKKIALSINFNSKAFNSRSNRYNALFVFVRNIIERSELDVISQDLATFKFKDTYLDLGREGSMKVNYEGINDELGIFDYIQGTQIWIDAGYPTLSSRITIPKYGFTVNDVINKCMDILDNGNY